jgi:N-acetylmuramoyl-L-alanine amidase
MLLFAFYLLKVIICSGVLFAYYWILLRNKIFHQYNRFYLLAAVALSLLAPLVQINIWHTAEAPAPSIKLLQVVTSSNEYLDEIVLTAHKNNFTTEQLAALLYLVTSGVFLSLFIQVFIKIRTLLKHHRQTVVDKVHFVNTTAKGTPFSFLQYIFWNDHIDINSITGNQVFKHELAHVQQKHSCDKLFLNAILIFCWCNPFFWLMRKELNMIHEFMADKIAVEDSDTEAFAAMILQATYPQYRFPLSNPFFYSPIKRRLMMLTKNNHPKAGYIGRILVLPLAAILFAAFTLKTKTIAKGPVYRGKTITVVLDAGHGGKDFGAASLDGKVTEKDMALSIVQKIKALNNNPNINLILSRESDIYQSPPEKADFSAAQHPDLFISIHIDAAVKDSAAIKTGMNVYVAKDNFANTSGSKLFASAVINEFFNNYKIPVAQLPLQRQVGIWVLQQSVCPAVLIDAGYITNKKDIAYLQTEEAKETIAKNVLAAIEKYALMQSNNINSANANPDTVPAKINFKVNRLIINDNNNISTATGEGNMSIGNAKKMLIIIDGKKINNANLKNVTLYAKKATIYSEQNKTAIMQYGEEAANGVLVLKDVTIEKNTSGDNETKLNIDEALIIDDGVKIVKEVQSNKLTDDVPVKKDNAVKHELNNEAAIKKENKEVSTTAPLQIISSVEDKNGNLITPLYVIDGEEKNEQAMNAIPPENIEKIEVLNNEKVKATYGEKAKNGVVFIITKKKNNYSAPEGKSQVAILKNDKIFSQVENQPKFPGGDSAWKNYLQKHLDPTIPVTEGWKAGQYKVMVSFVVNKDGSLTDITTENYKDSKTALACIDLIKKGPRWMPAIQNNHTVIAYKKQPITFVIQAQ